MHSVDEVPGGLGQHWFKESISKVVGNGERTSFWNDPWLQESVLKERFNRLYNLATNKNVMVAGAGAWWESGWKWVTNWRRPLFSWEAKLLNELKLILSSVELKENETDKWVWRQEATSIFSVKLAYKVIETL